VYTRKNALVLRIIKIKKLRRIHSHKTKKFKQKYLPKLQYTKGRNKITARNTLRHSKGNQYFLAKRTAKNGIKPGWVPS
jgi:hypothetical protein